MRTPSPSSFCAPSFLLLLQVTVPVSSPCLFLLHPFPSLEGVEREGELTHTQGDTHRGERGGGEHIYTQHHTHKVTHTYTHTHTLKHTRRRAGGG